MTLEPGSVFGALTGGALIGLAAALLLALNGRILGVSGIAASVVAAVSPERAERALFLAGMLAGGIAVGGLWPQALPGAVSQNVGWLIAAGLAVGFGTRLGGGCTSGHGVCGMARLSPRSLVATAIFMAVAGVTVYLIRHVFGATP
jgi:hypothetical protein